MDKVEINNTVIIGSREKREQYVWAILMRMNPRIYNQKEHGEIILKVRESLLEFTETLIKKFRWAGLKEYSRERKELEANGYTLKDAYQIVLKKIPVLELMEEEND